MLRLLATLAAASAQNAKLVIVAQFKNEAESLPQWLDHYLTDEGVAAMLLVDDNSTDSWRQAVEPYGARVRVRSGHAHRQVENYNLWLPTLRSEYSDDWVLIVDVDEYAYARRWSGMPCARPAFANCGSSTPAPRSTISARP